MLNKSTIRLLQIFAFVFAVFTTQLVLTAYSGIYQRIGGFFHQGFFHPSFFTPFEIIWLLLLVNLISGYRFVLRLNNQLLWFAFFSFAIRMINPNSETLNPILGMPLFSNLTEFILLFTFTIFIGLPQQICKLVLEKLFYYVMLFASIKAIALVIAYFAGIVTTFRSGFAIILPETDGQMLFSFLGAMSFTLYLLNHRTKFLFFSFLFISITFLSLQRSTALTGLIAIFFLVIFIVYKKLPMVYNRTLLIVISLIAGFQIILTQLPDSKLAMVTQRYIGITEKKSDVNDSFYSDTGHREQAMYTFINVINTMTFWGTGYGKVSERLFLEGQSTEIHNNYARLWAQHGIVTLLFFIVVLIIIIKNCLRLMYKIDRNTFKVYLIPLSVGFYLIGYFLAAWVSAGNLFFGHSSSFLFWFPMFIYLQISAEQVGISYVKTKLKPTLG